MYPGLTKPFPEPATSISIPADAWDVLVDDFDLCPTVVTDGNKLLDGVNIGGTIAQPWSQPANRRNLVLTDGPAIVTDCENAWSACEMADWRRSDLCRGAIAGLIDTHLSPTNNERLGRHPQASIGLRCYTFHELFDTDVTLRWSAIGGRQFVVTFGNVTIGMIAGNPSVAAMAIRSDTPDAAFQLAIKYTHGYAQQVVKPNP